MNIKEPSFWNKIPAFVWIILIILNLALFAVLLWPEINGSKTATQGPTSSEIIPTTLLSSETASLTDTPTPPEPISTTPNPSQFIVEQNDLPGMAFFSITDKNFPHIYAYNPINFKPQRITSTPWEEISPSVSPSKDKLAFSARQNGYWDIFIMDLRTGEITRITDTPEYDGFPTWSPDNQWLAYESYVNGNLDIWIKSLVDQNASTIQLTDSESAEYAPAWSPTGREIAFASTQTGEPEIWLADLNQVENRFKQISNDPEHTDSSPSWSPDGKILTWSFNHDGIDQIKLLEMDQADANVKIISNGILPTWSNDGKWITSVLVEPNQTGMVIYDYEKVTYLFPAIYMTGRINKIEWTDDSDFPAFMLNNPGIASESILKSDTSQNLAKKSFLTRNQLSEIEDTSATYPLLSQASIDSYLELRQYISEQTGWDVLGNISSAFQPLTTPKMPGGDENWLYTGRAIALNPLILNSGLAVISKEEIGYQTYWRIYLKTRYQDGSQGFPLKSQLWNLESRFGNDPKVYEAGGAVDEIPSGYYVDFTDLALSFGWERIPASENWRTFIDATNFNVFVQREGLTWQAAMLQIYPEEALNTPTLFPTRASTPTLTPTIRYYHSVTPSQPSSASSSPTIRPTWTPLAISTTP